MSAGSDASEEPRGFARAGPITGSASVPGSKSIAQRALLAAALASGRTRIVRVPAGEDVSALAGMLRAAGMALEELAPAAVLVHGRPPGPHGGFAAGGMLDAGESGTGARLVAAAVALCGRAGTRWELCAQGTLSARTSAPLFDALARAGAVVEPLGRAGGWPVRITSIGPPSDLMLEHPRSSQEASALLLAAAAWPDEIRVTIEGAVPSRPYLDMTLGVLRAFGVRISEERASDSRALFHVHGPLRAPEHPYEIEPDASSAAVALVAGCISGGEVQVDGFDDHSLQGDLRIVEHLRAFGCEAGIDHGSLWARGRPTRGAQVELSGEPDLAPPLAAVAAAAALATDQESVLTGLDTLPGKESSRIEVLADGLTRAGLAARAGSNRLTIAPSGRARPDLLLDPRGDHRMAFAFALLALLIPGIRVRNPICVAKSWPNFWRELERLGA